MFEYYDRCFKNFKKTEGCILMFDWLPDVDPKKRPDIPRPYPDNEDDFDEDEDFLVFI